MKKNFRILLVNPWIHDFAAFDFWSKPLGLLYIAALLRQAGLSVNLVDCLNSRHPSLIPSPKRRKDGSGRYHKEQIPKPAVLGHIERKYSRYGMPPALFRSELSGLERPDAVFVTSMMTYWHPGVSETITVIRETLPGIPVVLGGVYATLCAEHAMKHSGADLVFAGNLFSNLPGNLFTVSESGNYNQYSGGLGNILKKVLDDNSLGSEDFEDLDSLPYPAFDLIAGLDQVSMVTSIGCPYSCTYCASAYLNKTFNARDPIAVVNEIEFWKRSLGIRNFSFYDDALLFNAEERAVPMMEEIIRRKLECSFHCPNGLHIREINSVVASLMYRAGFKTIRFGLETAERNRQIASGGKVNSDEAVEAVRYLKEAGFGGDDVGVYLLYGLPWQEPSEVMESINFIKSLGAYPVMNEFSPVPHTALQASAIAVSPYDIEQEPLFHNNTILPCGGDTMTLEDCRILKKAARDCRKTLIQNKLRNSIRS
ncbi:MAG: radical SAM protein [Syntrophales bacterium]|nr:radical SAM protein [Syntrophales bacterium]